MSTTTFRTAVVRDPRGPESVEIVDVSVREPGAGEVRVRIEAASVNPADVWVADGFFHSIGLVTQPEHTGLGWDFAGTVLSAGEGVDIAAGTRVAGIVPGFDRDFGSYAEEIVAPVAWVAVVPDGLDTAAATTVPLNALTADQLVGLLGEGDGRRLLVTGAAGAVGGFVVRLAQQRGWAVTGLARPSDEAFVRGLGAEFTADDTAGGWDAVADAAGLQENAAPLVRDGGLFVGVRPAVLPEAGPGVTVRAVSVEPDAARLAALLDATARGDLPTKVAAELPLDAVVEALQTVNKGGVRGRVVLRP
ncbi:NADPH:quinone reductase-like Zn-dependent oxidoreductase [Nocardioides thalensis]|uniref:NADPH:quinone reductase-like Zn-dependent oxidoreductase n=1 Tax=Nocardioides thalensis TaxID=1914755 RepID=A0A853C602_9ACTN|nr:NADP-dependent oxidoreductase [Nocardioides thalensis]NYJ03255.1 NADPH:quinone reductase-like Zn-dependent oxidoreductase [Nocardioides thalensis]